MPATPELNPSRPHFNWLRALRYAARRGVVISHDLRIAWRIAARAWPTCACGQLCKALPRHNDGEPTDTRLSTLGCRFYADVTMGNWKAAILTFQAIESRSQDMLLAQAKLVRSKKK